MELAQMYAVIQTGGKQYRVEEGTYLKIEKLELGEGDTIEFDKVLMIQSDDDVKIGLPFIDGGKVTATVLSQGRHDKIKIIKLPMDKDICDLRGQIDEYYYEIK